MSFYNGILNHDDIHGSGLRGLPGIGFKLDSNNDYDMQNKKLVNVKQGTNNNDVITKSQLDVKTSLLDGARPSYVVNDKAAIYSGTGALHAQSLYLKDTPDGAGNSDEIRIMTEHQSYNNIHLHVPDLKNYDGYGGRPKSEMMITSVDQTVTGKKVFENIEVHDPTTNNQASNKIYVDSAIIKHNIWLDSTLPNKFVKNTGDSITGNLNINGNRIVHSGNPINDQDLVTKKYVDDEIVKIPQTDTTVFLKKTGDTMTGDLILPHDNYPVQGNTNKAVSYETQREIFLSRKESFPMQADINMNNNFIQNVATPTTSHQGANKGYCDYNFLNRQKGGRIMGSLSMNQNDLFEIPAPKFGSSAVNKNYVDGEISKITTVDTNQFVLKSGSTMTGDLNMNNYSIKNVGINLSDDTTAVPRSYVDSFVNSVIHNPLDGDLYANNHQIKNLKTPSEDNDAVTKKYFEDQLLQSHLLPSHKDNAFKYLLDQDESSSERNIIVNGIADFNGSPHKNKKAYNIDLIYTTGTQNYDSRIGINIYPLPVGKFTIIMEYYYPENINISVSCQASSAIINKQTSKNFTGYIKLLVQFEDQTKQTPDYLYFDIRGSGTTSTNPEGYLVFYGMKEWYDSINPKIYDHALETSMFGYDNDNMKMFRNIDMNNNKITNLSDGTDSNDAINKRQMDQLNLWTINYTYRFFFKNDFYDLLETLNFNLLSTSSGIIINVIKPNLFLGSNKNLNNYDKDYGVQINHGYIKLSKKINQSTDYTIFISLHLTNNIEIYFTNSTSSVHYYPQYGVNLAENKLTLKTSSSFSYSNLYKSDYNKKQVMLWICYDNSRRLCRMGICDYQSYVQQIYRPQITYQTDILSISYNGFIKKIGFIDKYYDMNGIEHNKIILEEKKNGSYFE